MSPAGDTIATDPSPSMDSAMDSFFSSSTEAPPAPDAGTAEGAPPDPGTEAASPAGDQPPAEGADAGAPLAPAGQPAPGTTPATDLPEGATLDAGGKQIRIDVPRFNNIYRDYKFAQELRAIAPDVKTAQEHYQRATDMRHMHADFISNDPARIDEVLNYWEGENPEAFGTLASRAIERAPEAVRSQLSQTMVSQWMDSLYAKAAQTGDPQDLFNARQVEYHATGQWRKDTAPKVDPLAAREQAIKAREDKLKADETTRAEQTWNGWKQGTYQQINADLTSKIDTLVDPVKDRFATAPDLLASLKRDIRNQAIRAVEGDREWLKNFNLDMDGSRRTMAPGDRAELVKMYGAKIDRVLASNAALLIKQATGLQVQQNQEAHARLAAASGQRGGGAPGAPVRTSVTTGQRDRAAMTLEEKIDADMAFS